jgi:Ca2+-transporting ATPase
MSNVWNAPGAEPLVTAKGAPEAIVAMCSLASDRGAQVVQAVAAMAAQGMRVLGVARAVASSDPSTWPGSQRDFAFEFLGLVGLADPLRASVPDAVRECRSAGIRVVMITGDHLATARAIAAQAGIPAEDALTGDDLARLDDAALAERLRTATIFARILPEQKLRIVQAYKATGAVVAMTGDGVNDAPSLKAAHIGIAMGKRGTEVAREAAAIVLLDEDFGAIVKAIRLGRRIYDNIRKAMGFIFAVHVPIAGLALLPLVLDLPVLFGPIHIALLEMIIDPVCALVFEAEAEEADVMRRPPRPSDEHLFSPRTVGFSLFQGGLAFLLVTAAFAWATRAGMAEPDIRALVFFALVAAIVALILGNRAFDASPVHAVARRNAALVYVLAAIAGLTIAILFVPFLRTLLGFGPLHWIDLTISASVGVLLLLLIELLKKLMRSRLAGGARTPGPVLAALSPS